MNALQGLMQAPQQSQNALSTAQPHQQPQTQAAYNGTVDYNGQPINVTNGIADFGGEKFQVSNDGMIVANAQRQFIGTIQNGKFIQATPEIIDQFKQMGVFEK